MTMTVADKPKEKTEIINIDDLPKTSNQALSALNRPKRLSLAEFSLLPVSEEELLLREKIYNLEKAMYLNEVCLVGQALDDFMTPIHRFAPGVYTRELTIPPGQIVVGKRHAIEHVVMLIKGKCLCVTERGIEEMTAPMHFISPAGEKRVVLTTDEECTWVTIHPTNETDLDKIEQDVIIAEPERLAIYEKDRQLMIGRT